jgi:hypothetical protein
MSSKRKTVEEMDAVVNEVSEQIHAGGSKFPGMSYEEGVEAALRWVLWDDSPNPMEEE